MAALCRSCGRGNPQGARYCYFDGASLPGTVLGGPVDHARAPFSAPFPFPSGISPRNLDQLALACQHQWDEARSLLKNGTLQEFFVREDRTDLATAARAAAAMADLDQGLDYLLSRLPSFNVMPPRLHVEPATVDLGRLVAGKDQAFELKLSNRGHRLIHGSVSSDCPWLQPEGAPAGQPRLVQFTAEHRLRILLPGPALMAALQPWRGQVFIETSAGSAVVPVSCDIPVVPFPDGVLQGCRTPRQLAEAARQYPREAAELFYQGAVAAWYRSNGWTYPVEGTAASGVAAVQQFFEALGLARPPRIVLDTPALAFHGNPGERLSQQVHLHAEEMRAVHLTAQSPESWLSVTSGPGQGNRASLVVEVVVPDAPGSVFETQLRIKANGNQHFQVPVVVQVAGTAPWPQQFEPLYEPEHHESSWGRRLVGAAMLLVFLGMLGFLGVLGYQQLPFGKATPLTSYAAAIAADTAVACHVDLQALGRGADSVDEVTAALAESLADLGLQGDAARVHKVLLVYTLGEPPLEVWTLAAPAHFRTVVQGRFEAKSLSKTLALYLDRAEPTHAWATDEHGRVLHGPARAVQEAVRRGRTRQRTQTFERLSEAAAGLPEKAGAWALVDGRGAASAGLPDLQVLRAALVPRGSRGWTLEAYAEFATAAAATACRARLIAAGDVQVPLIEPEWLDKAKFQQQESVLQATLMFDGMPLDAAARLATAELQAAQRRHADAVELLCQEELEPGRRAMKFDDYATAVQAFGKAAGLFPGNATANALWLEAQQKQRARQMYLQNLQAVRDALAAVNLPQARDRLTQVKAGPFTARDIEPLEKELVRQEQLAAFKKTVRGAEDALRLEDFVRAADLYQTALKLQDDDAVKQTLSGIKRVQDVEATLARAAKLRAAEQLLEAGGELRKALELLVKEPALWRVEPLPYWRGRLLGKAAFACQTLQATYRNLADQAEDDARVAKARANFAAAAKDYARATRWAEEAKMVADEVQRSGAEGVGDLKATLRTIDERLIGLKRAARQAHAEGLVWAGTTALAEGKRSLAKARTNSALLAEAKAKVDAGVASLREAHKLGGVDVAGALREAEALAERFGRLAEPVDIDFALGVPPTWKQEKDQWEQRAGMGGGWLQPARVASANLMSDIWPWPHEFQLELTFALVTPAGKISNQLWESFADPLTLTLVNDDPEGTPLVLRVGKDPTLPLQNQARLTLGKDTVSLQGLLPANQPIKLLLECKNQVLQASVNGRKLRSVPARHGFGQLRIDAASPYNAALSRYIAFPALFHLSLKPL